VVKRRVLKFGDKISFVAPCRARTLGYILFRRLSGEPRAEAEGAGLRARKPSSDPHATGAAAAGVRPPSAQQLAPGGDNNSFTARHKRHGAAGARAWIGSLTSNDVHLILAQLDPDDLINARLACKAFRDQSKPFTLKHRRAYLRTRALAAYAWNALPAYRIARAQRLWERWSSKLNLGCTSARITCAPSVTRAACSVGSGAWLADARAGLS
jgi:hypothetical protein